MLSSGLYAAKVPLVSSVAVSGRHFVVTALKYVTLTGWGSRGNIIRVDMCSAWVSVLNPSTQPSQL